jgi:hypothetical protein
LPGRNTSTVSGMFCRHESGGYSSAEYISGGVIIGTSEFAVANGVRAHGGRIGVSPVSLWVVSTGMFTTTFLPFGAGVDAACGGGKGLSLRPGPPRGAFGGPPMLTLGALLLRGMKGCPNGGTI